MTAAAKFKQEDVKRAVAGASKAGMRIGRVEIRTDGTIVLLTESDTSAPASANPWDDDLKQ